MKIINLIQEYKEDIMKANKKGFNKSALFGYEKGSIRNCEAYALYSIIRKHKLKKILDIGTGKGFSALIFAKALFDEKIDGHIDTIDINQNFDSNLFKNFNFEKYVKFYKNSSNEVLPTLKGKYDLVLIDGEHSYKQTKKDFLNVFKKVKLNRFIAFHDAYPKPNTNPNGVINVIKEIQTENVGEFSFFKEDLFDFFSFEDDIKDATRMYNKWQQHNFSYASREANPKELMAVFTKKKSKINLEQEFQKNIEDEDFLKEWLN